MTHPLDLNDLTHGFLPINDPIESLPSECCDWEAVALELPKLLAGAYLRTIIESLPPFPIESLKNEEQLERAMLILSYLGHAYVWCQGDTIQTIPQNLATAWYEVATKLGRPPVLSYASYALYNWRRIDLEQPIELGNIALLQNFLGGIDEEWFILIHVDIEAKAIPAIQSVPSAQDAAKNQDPDQLRTALTTMADSIELMCQVLDRMPEFCDPYIYYNRVRPYIHGWKNNPALPNGLIYEGVTAYNNQPQLFKGETGAQSAIIPCLDAVLKVQHADNPLRVHLNEMRQYMPPQHLQFLERIESGPSIRDAVMNIKNKELTAVYNRCLELIYRFRATHLNYAAQYIQKQAQTSDANPTEIGTGGTPFMDYLKKHRDETEQFLI